jgi:hypothetical protein
MLRSDLNYRVNLQDADVRGLLVSDIGDSVQTLLKYDQVSRDIPCLFRYPSYLPISGIKLKNAQRDKRAFDNFVEHPISHIP